MHVAKVKGFSVKAGNKDKNLNFLSFALHTNPFHQMIQTHSIYFPISIPFSQLLSSPNPATTFHTYK